jgi:hypothetical protein
VGNARASAAHLVDAHLPNTSLALLFFRVRFTSRLDSPTGPPAIAKRLLDISANSDYVKQNVLGPTALYDAVLVALHLLRVAQLGEHLLCEHAFISPKPLNRRLLIVQPSTSWATQWVTDDCKDALVQVWTNILINGTRFESSERYQKNDLGWLFCNRGNDS